jgi:hypothetical protein
VTAWVASACYMLVRPVAGASLQSRRVTVRSKSNNAMMRAVRAQVPGGAGPSSRQRSPSSLERGLSSRRRDPRSGRHGSGSDRDGPEPKEFEHDKLQAVLVTRTMPR